MRIDGASSIQSLVDGLNFKYVHKVRISFIKASVDTDSEGNFTIFLRDYNTVPLGQGYGKIYPDGRVNWFEFSPEPLWLQMAVFWCRRIGTIKPLYAARYQA